MIKKIQRYFEQTYQEISVFHYLFRDSVIPISCFGCSVCDIIDERCI